MSCVAAGGAGQSSLPDRFAIGGPQPRPAAHRGLAGLSPRSLTGGTFASRALQRIAPCRILRMEAWATDVAAGRLPLPLDRQRDNRQHAAEFGRQRADGSSDDANTPPASVVRPNGFPRKARVAGASARTCVDRRACRSRELFPRHRSSLLPSPVARVAPRRKSRACRAHRARQFRAATNKNRAGRVPFERRSSIGRSLALPCIPEKPR